MASTEGISEELTLATEGQPPSRGGLVVFLFGLAFMHGLVINLMPIMFPTIGERFGLDQAHRGLLQTSFTVGTVVALVIAGYLVNYVGAKWVAVLVTVLSGGGALLFGLAGSYPLTLLGAALMSLGIAPLIAVYAAVITAKFSDIRQRMYMWTFAVLAASATLSTALIGGLITAIRYNLVFVIFGLFLWGWMALLLAVAGRSLDREVGKAYLGAGHKREATGGILQNLGSLLRFLIVGLWTRGALYLLGFLVILDNLASGNLLAWTPSFFKESYGIANIGVVLSASSAGVLFGRLLLGALPPGRITDRNLLALCYTGAMIVFALILLLQPGYLVALFLIFLSGAFTSAQAPTTYSLATAKFGDRAPAAIPLVDAIGTVGAFIGPPLLGWLGDRAGELQSVMWFIPATGMGLVVTAVLWELHDRARGIRTEAGRVSEEGPFG